MNTMNQLTIYALTLRALLEEAAVLHLTAQNTTIPAHVLAEVFVAIEF